LIFQIGFCIFNANSHWETRRFFLCCLGALQGEAIMKKSFWVVVLAVLSVAGCGVHVEVIKLNPPDHVISPKDPANVKVFTSGGPSRPYTEAYMLNSTQEAFSASRTPEIIEEMRKKAAELGCDALIITGSNDTTLYGSPHSFTETARIYKGFHGSCIMYR
jgi:hypothetical protein